MFSLLYVPSQITVAGNAPATVLTLLSGADYLRAFTVEQMHAR
jgi:hypothetical protein